MDALQNPALARYAELSADACRTMGVKEYYLSHFNAAHEHSVASAKDLSTLDVAQHRDPSSPIPLNVAAQEPSHHQKSASVVPPSLVALYRQRKRMLIPAVFTALTSVAVGLALGNIISIMILVACLPTLIAFFVHWKCMTSDGSAYPIRWRIGFPLFFASVFSLSLGIMLSDAAILQNALGKLSYGLQATTGFCLFLFCSFALLFASWQSCRNNEKFEIRRSDRVSHLFLVFVLLAAFFFFVAATCGALFQYPYYAVIRRSQRVYTHPHSNTKLKSKNLNPQLKTHFLSPTLNPPPFLSPQLHNGYIYVTVQQRYVNSFVLQQNGQTGGEVPAGFEVAPGDANDVSVCAAKAWQSDYLIFSDGSGCGTAACETPADIGDFNLF
jgi:hypothetical protein